MRPWTWTDDRGAGHLLACDGVLAVRGQIVDCRGCGVADPRDLDPRV